MSRILSLQMPCLCQTSGEILSLVNHCRAVLRVLELLPSREGGVEILTAETDQEVGLSIRDGPLRDGEDLATEGSSRVSDQKRENPGVTTTRLDLLQVKEQQKTFKENPQNEEIKEEKEGWGERMALNVGIGSRLKLCSAVKPRVCLAGQGDP